MKLHSIVALSLVLVACSSASAKKEPDPVNGPAPEQGGAMAGDTPATNPAPTPSPSDDGGTSTPTPEVDAGPHVPTNQAECVSACELKYPKPAALNKQLDSQCFTGGTCEPVCDNLVYTGKDYGVTVDADASAPIACPIGEGVDPIKTPSQACSDCLAKTPTCCTLWIDIFGTADGRSLNACANTCFSSFKN